MGIETLLHKTYLWRLYQVEKAGGVREELKLLFCKLASVIQDIGEKGEEVREELKQGG